MKASQGDYTTLFIFLMLVLGVGFAIGPTIRPGQWHQALAKPWFYATELAVRASLDVSLHLDRYRGLAAHNQRGIQFPRFPVFGLYRCF